MEKAEQHIQTMDISNAFLNELMKLCHLIKLSINYERNLSSQSKSR